MSSNTFTGGQEQIRDWLVFHEAIEEKGAELPCRQFPDAYFSEEYELRELARLGCESCPVQLECLQYGIKWEDSGMYGGLTATERRGIREARKKRVA